MADRPGEAAIRANALKWREIAARDGGGIDRKAEETLALLDRLSEALELLADLAMEGKILGLGDPAAEVNDQTGVLGEAEERFAAMKQRVEASHSTPAYRRHHETWQEAADRLMRERDGETIRATKALARLSDYEQALRAREVARADADYVLRWLEQTEAPANIIGLQTRVRAAALSGSAGNEPAPGEALR